jgi:hypothetical protein
MQMKHLKTFDGFITENESVEEGMISKFFTGFDSKEEKQAAEAAFTKALDAAEKAVKADPKAFGKSMQKWDVVKAFLMGKASANKFLGGLRTSKSKSDGLLYVVYDEGATGFEAIASSTKPGIGRLGSQ